MIKTFVVTINLQQNLLKNEKECMKKKEKDEEGSILESARLNVFNDE